MKNIDLKKLKVEELNSEAESISGGFFLDPISASLFLLGATCLVAGYVYEKYC
jgi:hypothetical protein